MWNWFLSHFNREHQQDIRDYIFMAKTVIVIGLGMVITFGLLYYFHND